MRVLPREFYARKADIVAQELLGKLIVRTTKKGDITAKIVETEAYFGNGSDPASHAFKGPTPRSAIMFGNPGAAYVYFTYGMHWLLNFVAKEDGEAG
ncbi:MAG: DNA-3-methyladenine glycosylase, partial [Actinobacteria bacterium]